MMLLAKIVTIGMVALVGANDLVVANEGRENEMLFAVSFGGDRSWGSPTPSREIPPSQPPAYPPLPPPSPPPAHPPLPPPSSPPFSSRF